MDICLEQYCIGVDQQIHHSFLNAGNLCWFG